MNDKWVMVRDHDHNDWEPRISLYDFGDKRASRYLCLSEDKSTILRWREMRPAKAIELLPMLPGGWAKRAVKRVKECPYKPDREVETLAEAVSSAFIWHGTPEGYDAWESLRNALRDGTAIKDTIDPVPTMEMFELELIKLINSHCIESRVDMPDFLLAGMICSMIEAMGPSIKKTLDWHGCDSVCAKRDAGTAAGEAT